MTMTDPAPKPPEGYATWLDWLLQDWSTPISDPELVRRAKWARAEFVMLRARSAKAVDEEAVRRAVRKELLDQACDVLTRHNGAAMMRCGCPECRHAESFAAQLANCIIDADRARDRKGGGS